MVNIKVIHLYKPQTMFCITLVTKVIIMISMLTDALHIRTKVVFGAWPFHD